MPQKRCFVVMGFGIKTDLATGRKLNLDESYKRLIKPVVEGKGLECIRADEIRHSGLIDVPMYKHLLSADVVVADISTANANALYELGVRHALKPRTTIVISEQMLCYPFDLNHILINKYTHSGENIDYAEVLKFQKMLGETLDAVIDSPDPDSPVYTFLNGLIPPQLQKEAEKMAKKVDDAIKDSRDEDEEEDNNKEKNPTLAFIIDQGREALQKKDYEGAKALFKAAMQIANCTSNQKLVTTNSYLFHSLALATYKAEKPDEITALKDAIDILDDLDLQHTNDSETVELAGKIEKRLFLYGQGDTHLAAAIQYLERAYFLLHNRKNGINLAFLINMRLNLPGTSTQDKIVDLVLANRIRKSVLEMCEKDWNKIIENNKNTEEKQEVLQDNKELAKSQKVIENEQKFWILVNKAEAHFGLGEMEKYNQARQDAQQIKHEPWMWEAFEEQVSRLGEIMRMHGALLSPPWREN